MKTLITMIALMTTSALFARPSTLHDEDLAIEMAESINYTSWEAIDAIENLRSSSSAPRVAKYRLGLLQEDTLDLLDLLYEDAREAKIKQKFKALAKTYEDVEASGYTLSRRHSDARDLKRAFRYLGSQFFELCEAITPGSRICL